MSHVFTYEAKFPPKHYKMLNEYFEEFCFAKYAHILHLAVRDLQSGKTVAELRRSDSYCGEYKMSGRAINSIAREAQGLLDAQRELRNTTIKNLKQKIGSLQSDIEKLTAQVISFKEKAADNRLKDKELEKFRRKRTSLHYKHLRVNRLTQSLERQKRLQGQGKYNICFGTKDLFRTQFNLKAGRFKCHSDWLLAWRKARQHQARYVGERASYSGNQECRLFERNMPLWFDTSDDPRNNRMLFGLSIKLDDSFELGRSGLRFKRNSGAVDLFFDDITFGYGEQEILEVLREKTSPLTFRVVHRKNDWFLQVTLTRDSTAKDVSVSWSKYGTVGLDFNSGFIQLCETDEVGNPICFQRFDLSHHGGGKQSETELSRVLSDITKNALSLHKAVAIESLNFSKKKARLIKGKNKRYNKMLSDLDFARYQKAIDSSCFRRGVDLVRVNPAYTSQKGKVYSKQLGCNTHMGAAYVIARVGQGIKEQYVTENNRLIPIILAA